MWLIFAILSSLFASIMTILMKVGLKNLDSTLVTCLRTSIVFMLLWIIIFIFNKQKEIKSININEWKYIVLASLATCLTWVFYFLALKQTTVSKVVAVDRLSIVFSIIFSVIFLKEKLTFMTLIGITILVIGTVLVILG